MERQYTRPEKVEALSTGQENDLFIDPQERFIILNRYFASTRTLDLFISFSTEKGWTEPRLLDAVNSIVDWELTPTLSPDGKYFFYELGQLIMQVELDALIYADEPYPSGRLTRDTGRSF